MDCHKFCLLGKFYGQEENRKLMPTWTSNSNFYPQGAPSCIYVTMVCHSWKPEVLFLCLDTSLQMYSSLPRCCISPKSNHPFELLITEFLPYVCFLHVLINFCLFFFFKKFIFFQSSLQGLHLKAWSVEGKHFFLPYSSYINYLEFFCKKNLSLIFSLYHWNWFSSPYPHC